jgi:PAS domain-containing protein
MMLLSKYSRSTILKKVSKTASLAMVTVLRPLGHQSEESSRSEWSETMSYASPESDFCASNIFSESTRLGDSHIWSESLSFTSPESDFVGTQAREGKQSAAGPIWSELLSFTSPKADFTTVDGLPYGPLWSETHFFARRPEIDLDNEDYQLPPEYESILHSLTFLSSPETAIGVIHYAEMLDGPLKTQLSEQKERVASLPHTMSEASADYCPIVITSASSLFTVVDVNDAWVGLCEYSREEALHQNLGDLLQGPETDPQVTQHMISRLKRDDYSEAFVTNYAKSGRKFQSHIYIFYILFFNFRLSVFY